MEERIKEETIQKLELMIDMIKSGDFHVNHVCTKCSGRESLSLGEPPAQEQVFELEISFFGVEKLT